MLCEAKVGGQSGRLCEAEVGGRARPIWETVRGQSGRSCEAVRGRWRPNLEAM